MKNHSSERKPIMPLRQKLHLIDELGHPLDERYQRAVDELSGIFQRRFRQLNDPAVVANLIEESATRANAIERKNGRVEKLKPLLVRVFSNLAKTLLCRSHYNFEKWIADGELANYPSAGSPLTEADILTLRKALSSLNEKKQFALRMFSQGCTAKEIAHELNTTEENVWQMLRRARAEARKALSRKHLHPR